MHGGEKDESLMEKCGCVSMRERVKVRQCVCVRLRKKGRKVCVNMCLREREKERCVLDNVSWPRQQVKVASRPGIIQSTHT